jgi:quinol monooxygenase YgiN
MGSPDPVVVVARWRPGVESVGNVLALVAELREQTLQEPGCLGYDVFQGVDSPGELLLLERYLDDRAIEAHRGSAHYQEFVVRRILPLLADRKVEVLRVRDAG